MLTHRSLCIISNLNKFSSNVFNLIITQFNKCIYSNILIKFKSKPQYF